MTKDKILLAGHTSLILASAIKKAVSESESQVIVVGNTEQERGLTINEPTPFVITNPYKPTPFDDEIETAKMRRAASDRRPVTPPRSMTPEELAYYKIHKTLKGFTNE